MSRSRPLLFGVLVLALHVPAVSAQKGPLSGLDAYVEKALRDWEVPGAAVAIVRNDSVIYARGYGVREIGKREPVDERTLFAIASTSKAFTAALVAMLVDEGKLEWDDPVTQHLPGFRLADPYANYELTIRDVLSHRSGLPRGDMVWYLSPFDRNEVIRRLRFLEPQSSFRSRYGYQNIMFITAGELAGRVMGKSWDDAVRERIFEPLGMTRTSTSVRALQGQTNLATAHDRIEGRVQPIRWPNYDNLGGAGSMNSSVWDMAQWLRLQLGKGEYQGKRILSDSVVKEMHTPQTVIRRGAEAEKLYPETHFQAYGLGWTLRDYRGRKIVGHGGVLDGMRTEVALVPEERLGVVVMANLDGTSLPNAVVNRVLDGFLGAQGKDWSAVLLAAAKQARVRADSTRKDFESKRVTGTRPTLALERYAGEYADSLYGKVIVTESGGSLALRFGAAYVGQLEHWHYDTFRVTYTDVALGRDYATFVLDASGKPAELRLRNIGRFARLPDKPPATNAASN